MSDSKLSSKDQLYYLQVRGFAGNSLLWWRNGRSGYTADIKQAHVFTNDEAFAQQRCRPDEDSPWRKSYIDSILQHHVHCEKVDRDEEAAYVATAEPAQSQNSLVTRLRAKEAGSTTEDANLMEEAALEIELLEHRVANLRAALEPGALLNDELVVWQCQCGWINLDRESPFCSGCDKKRSPPTKPDALVNVNAGYCALCDDEREPASPYCKRHRMGEPVESVVEQLERLRAAYVPLKTDGEVNPAPDADAPSTPSGQVGFTTVTR